MASIHERDVFAAAEAGLIQPEQVAPLWQFFEKKSADRLEQSGPRFTFTHVLYYLGGLLAIGAMSLFMTLGWESFGGWGLFFIALLYAGVAFKAASLFESKQMHIPAGIMATLVVVLVPLGTYGLLHALDVFDSRSYRDYHAYIDGRWLVLELATFLIGSLMLYRYRYPFLVMPLSVTLWYFSMDVLPALFTGSSSGDWFDGPAGDARKYISLVFGVLMLGGALFVDLRSRFSKDYAFWLYLFGLLTAWGALTSMGSGELLGKLVYLVINIGLVLTGAIIGRRAFTIFGALGIAIVLGDLAYRVFKESIAFPFALTVLGFATIGAGVWWQKHHDEVSIGLRARLPRSLRELLETRQAQR